MLVLVDGNYLGNLARFTTGKGLRNGSLYGFMKQLVALRKKFPDADIYICWDSPGLIRRDMLPSYKQNRASSCPQAQAELEDFWAQLDACRTWIEDCGGVGQLREPRFEADDLIAGAVLNREAGERVVIVSSDSDLYQLINKDCALYNPRKNRGPGVTLYGLAEFRAEHGIAPAVWPMVKAIAGDTADNIKGLPRVGVKTAVKILKGDATTRQLDALVEFDRVVQTNLALVKLPHAALDLPVELLEVPAFDQSRWDEQAMVWQMPSLRGLKI